MFKSDTRKWVLIVEDDDEFREMLINTVMAEVGDEIRYVVAKDGVEATNRINQQKFHCIITDIEMPKKGGNQFISLVRQNQFNEMTPVIVMSGNVGKEVELMHSFTYFFKKPFNMVQFIDLLKTLMDRGSTKATFSAQLYNSYIGKVVEILGLHFKQEDVAIQSPLTKIYSRGEMSDYLVSIEVNIAKVVNVIGFVIDEESLAFIGDKISLKSLSSSEIAQQFAQMLVNEIISTNSNIALQRLSVQIRDKVSDNKMSLPRIVTPINVNKDFAIEVFGRVS